MATKKSSKPASKTPITVPPQPPEEKDVLDTDRLEVIRMAACESLDWLAILQALSESDTFDQPTFYRRLPGILHRLEELSGIVLSSIDDPSHETAALRQSLNNKGGTAAPRQD